jgi:outer membrane lipoprotein-sorting protein
MRMISHLTAAFLMLVSPAWAEQSAEEKGFQTAARSDRSDVGFKDSRVDLKMVLRNAARQEVTRELTLNTLEKDDEQTGDKTLVIFSLPSDIRDTALLSHAKILDSDDQWLYLPSLKRVKRISSHNKSGPFVGSEFSYEDFTALELNKFSYQYLREDMVDGLAVDVISRSPRYENSGYSKQIVFIDRDIFQIRKIEFYDRKDELLKTLDLQDYRQYANVWRAHKLLMVNHQTGKSTDLFYSDYRFGTGLSAQDFDQSILEGIR